MDKNYLSILKNMNQQDKGKKKAAVVLNEQVGKDIEVTVIEWFTSNPYPSDDDVHKFAESLNIDHDKLEATIYKILSSFLCEGRSKDFKGKYDPKEMKMGIKVEMEHTTNSTLSEKIAKDHVAEIPDYYTRLLKMEKEAGIED